MATGARVRNTYAIYLVQGHNFEKSVLIPHNIEMWHHILIKAEAVQDEHASN